MERSTKSTCKVQPKARSDPPPPPPRPQQRDDSADDETSDGDVLAIEMNPVVKPNRALESQIFHRHRHRIGLGLGWSIRVGDSACWARDCAICLVRCTLAQRIMMTVDPAIHDPKSKMMKRLQLSRHLHTHLVGGLILECLRHLWHPGDARLAVRLRGRLLLQHAVQVVRAQVDLIAHGRGVHVRMRRAIRAIVAVHRLARVADVRVRLENASCEVKVLLARRRRQRVDAAGAQLLALVAVAVESQPSESRLRS